MYDDNWNDGRGLVIVRRVVYTAGTRLQRQALTDPRGLTDWNLAQEQRDLFRQQSDHEIADFWHEVYQYLMTLECVDYDAEIRIID